jgi:hypothetical protein
MPSLLHSARRHACNGNYWTALRLLNELETVAPLTAIYWRARITASYRAA